MYRTRDCNTPKVTILSGGGSGHEPGHAGYVAEGMLDAAVSGPIFASPNAKHVRTGLRHVASPKGTLIIVKNYTGDRLNFGLAAEHSRAYDSYDVQLVSVQDDVSVPRSRSGLVGRRGLAGVVLVHKIAGASAAEGNSLAQVTANARSVADRIATIGVSLNGCSVPGVLESRSIAPGEMELGMGIHNEPGTQNITGDKSTKSLISMMLSTILDQNDPQRGYLKYDKESRFVLLINNLGGLSKLELLSLTHHVLHGLESKYDIAPCRVFSGTYLSSLDGSGFSVTLLALPVGSEGDNLLRLLDAPTKSVNWPPALPISTRYEANGPLDSRKDSDEKESSAPLGRTITCEYSLLICTRLYPVTDILSDDRMLFGKIIKHIHTSLVSAEPEITRFDTYLGDGDCGTTLLAGSSGLVNAFSSENIKGLTPSDLIADMQRLTDVLGTQMGGTSGALYSIFFSGFVSGIQQLFKSQPDIEISLPVLSEALAQGLATMRRYTSANVGDRTMMDALIPFVEAMQQQKSSGLTLALGAAFEAAKTGCESTRQQESRYGRSTYVGAASDAKLEADSMPDPGACGVVAIIQGILNAVSESN